MAHVARQPDQPVQAVDWRLQDDAIRTALREKAIPRLVADLERQAREQAQTTSSGWATLGGLLLGAAALARAASTRR